MADSKPAKTKLKTHKTAAARLNISGSGKLMRSNGTRRARKKRREVLNDRKEMFDVDKTMVKRSLRLIPNGVH